MSPVVAGTRRGAALPIAAAAVLVLVVVEVLDALGRPGPGRGWLSVILALVATVAVLAALRGVTRDRQASRSLETELRASEQQAAGITAIAVDSIITVDEEQRIVVFNHGAETTFGWKAADVMGQPLSILLPDRFHDVHERHIKRFGSGADVARRMGQRQRIVGRRSDGAEFPAEASISRLDLPGRRLYTVLLRDITEQYRQHEQNTATKFRQQRHAGDGQRQRQHEHASADVRAPSQRCVGERGHGIDHQADLSRERPP